MPVPTDEITRLSTGEPTGYNNGNYNASTNPYGFASGGHRVNLYELTNDVTVVTEWLIDEIAPIVDIADEIEALGAIASELSALAAITSDITALGALTTQITALAAIAADITTVATNAADVTAVANDIDKVAAVDAALADITAVAAALTNIATVVGMAADITTVVARAADIAALADIEDGTTATGAIQAVAAIAAAVDNVSDNSADVVAVAGALADVNTVAGIAADVSNVGPIAGDVSAVAAISTDVETAADNIAAIIAAPAAAIAARKSVRHIIFDSGTADAHPGAGHFRLSFDINAASVGATGFIYEDIEDANGASIVGFLESWDDVINATGRGNITLVGEADPSIAHTLRVTGSVTSGTSYRKAPVTLLDKSGTVTDEDEFTQTFQPYGNDGGGGAGTGDVVSTGAITSGNLVQYADGTGDVIEDSGKAVANLFDTTANDLDDIDDGSTYVKFSATEQTKLGTVEDSADVTDAVNVGSSIHGSTAKTPPVDADTMPLIDSAASNVLKKVTWANIKATLKTYFDTLYSAASHTHALSAVTSRTATYASDITGLTGKTTPVDADELALIDSAASNVLKKLTWANLKATIKAYTDTLYHIVGGTDVPVADGGTGSSTAAGARTNLGITGPDHVANLGISASVGSSALTVALRQANGSSNATSTAPVVLAMRSATAATGGYNERTATGALSLTVPSGGTLGQSNGVAATIFVYLLDNSGTLELVVSGTDLGASGILTSTTIGTGSDSASGIYSTTGRSNMPFRKIAEMVNTQTTAGTWAAVPSTIRLAPFTTGLASGLDLMLLTEV